MLLPTTPPTHPQRTEPPPLQRAKHSSQRVRQQEGRIQELLSKIIPNVLPYCDPQTVARCQKVCSTWQNIKPRTTGRIPQRRLFLPEATAPNKPCPPPIQQFQQQTPSLTPSTLSSISSTFQNFKPLKRD